MGAKRRRIEAALKAKAALAAVRGDRTISELASHFAVHATQIGQWGSSAEFVGKIGGWLAMETCVFGGMGRADE